MAWEEASLPILWSLDYGTTARSGVPWEGALSCNHHTECKAAFACMYYLSQISSHN